MKSHQTRNWLSCQMLLEEQIADERHPTCTNLLLESSDFVYTRLLFLFGLLLCLALYKHSVMLCRNVM